MNLTTCIMYLCCASVVSNLSLLPRKFLILNFYRHENARWTRIIIIITIISGSVHCYTIIYQMCTKHILLHGAYIRHAASCSHPYYIVIVYTCINILQCAGRRQPLYLTAIFCHQTFDLWPCLSHINNILNIYIATRQK